MGANIPESVTGLKGIFQHEFVRHGVIWKLDFTKAGYNMSQIQGLYTKANALFFSYGWTIANNVLLKAYYIQGLCEALIHVSRHDNFSL